MKRILIAFFLQALLLPFFPQSAEDYLSRLSPMEQVSQIFLINIEGNRHYNPVEYDENNNPLVPGGCLLFSYNIAPTFEEVQDFTSSIKGYCDERNILPPYVAVDQEGGDVCRLRGITSYLPSNFSVAGTMSPTQAYELYSQQAVQMKKLGITMNLAPVVEASIESNKEFLGTRTFGEPPEAMVYSFAEILAYENNGVGTVLKHFPGNTNTDPHSGLPEIELTEDEVWRYMIQPFHFVLNANPSCVLMSHARVKAADSNSPSCLSSYWVNEVLHKKLNFNGLVISDDIFMAALQKNGYPPEVASVQAIDSGVHVLMLSEKRYRKVAEFLLKEAMENPSFAKKLHDAEIKVIEFKIAKGVI